MSELHPDIKLDWPALMDTALNAPGRLSDTYSRFTNYSFGNMVLLMMQGVSEPVAGYQRWVQLGRQVKRGASGKYILHPMVKKIEVEDKPAKNAVVGFKLKKSVFTYSDTDGEPLPDVPPVDWDRARALDELGIEEVPFETLNFNSQGYSTGNRIAINPTAKYPLKTTWHELGHVMLKHTTPEGMQEYRTHRGVMEFQAEATAYLGMHELGLDEHMNAAESRSYIRSWLGGETPDDKAIKGVFAATTKILQAGRQAIASAEEPAA